MESGKGPMLLVAILFLTASACSAQWAQTNGPFCGGDVGFLYARGKVVLAGVSAPVTSSPNLVRAEIFRSTDNGQSWSGVYAAGTRTFFTASLRVGSKLIVGTDEGIMMSTDGGRSWFEPDTNMRRIRILSLFKRYESGGTEVLACTRYRGLYRSTDEGKSWSIVDPGLVNILSAVAYRGEIYAATDTGVIVSTDGGANWHEAGLRYYYTSRLGVVSNSVLFAQTNGGIFYSIDGGKDWIVTNRVGPDEYVNMREIEGGRIFVSSRKGMFVSRDMGMTWKTFNPEVHDVTSMSIDRNYVYVGSRRNGVSRSTDGGKTWNDANHGLMTAGVLHLGTNENAVFAGSKGFGLYKSTDSGRVWTKLEIGAPARYFQSGFIVALQMSGNTLYVRTWNGLFSSNDGGVNWRQTYMEGRQGKWFRASLAANDSDVFAGTWGGLLHSTNGGDAWTWSDSGMSLGSGRRPLPISVRESYMGPMKKGPGGRHGELVRKITPRVPPPRPWVRERKLKVVQAIAFVGKNLIAGTTGGEVFLSTNDGALWTKLDSNITDKEFLQFVRVGSDLYALTEGDGVLRSEDGGRSWVKVNNGFTDFDAHVLVHSGNDLFVGAGNGVYYSDNRGRNWTMVNRGLRDSVIVGLTIRGDYLYCGSWDYGVWRRAVSDIVKSVHKAESEELPRNKEE